MITIKLQRHNSRKKQFYSIIVLDNTLKPSSGCFIEKIGHYDPVLDSWLTKTVHVDLNRLFFWIKRGVKVNKTLYILIKPLLFYKITN